MFKLHGSFVKTVVRLVLVLVPALMALLPKEWMNVTLSGVLLIGFDWLKAKYSTL